MYACGLEIQNNKCPYLCEDHIHCDAPVDSPCGFIRGRDERILHTSRSKEKKEKWFEKYWK